MRRWMISPSPSVLCRELKDEEADAGDGSGGDEYDSMRKNRQLDSSSPDKKRKNRCTGRQERGSHQDPEQRVSHATHSALLSKGRTGNLPGLS